jgi:hypothetical protein
LEKKKYHTCTGNKTKLNKTSQRGINFIFPLASQRSHKRKKAVLKNIAPYPNTTSILSRGCSGMAASLLPFDRLYISMNRKRIEAIKHTLQMNTSFEKKRMLKDLYIQKFINSCVQPFH